MAQEIRKPIYDDNGLAVDFVTVRVGAGRPKSPPTLSATAKALNDSAKERSLDQPPRVDLKGDYGVDGVYVAAALDWLNGYEADDRLEMALRSYYGDEWKRVMQDERNVVAFHIITVLNHYIEQVAQRHELFGNYVTKFTTSSMSSVLGAGSGVRRKDGSLR